MTKTILRILSALQQTKWAKKHSPSVFLHNVKKEDIPDDWIKVEAGVYKNTTDLFDITAFTI